MQTFAASLSAIRHFPTTRFMRAKALRCPRHFFAPGSLTVEAAFVLPLFFFAALLFLCFFQVLTVETEVTKALQYAARTIAADCSDTNTDAAAGLISLYRCRTEVNSMLSESEESGAIPADRLLDFSLSGSDCSGDYIYLCASYKISLPLSLWGVDSLPASHCVKAKKWNGASKDSADTAVRYVYVTATGTAYHSSRSCPYLSLSIQSVSFSDLSSLRNKSGGKYYPCSCFKEGDATVYVTDYGTQYHSSLECSSLKRTVYRIDIEDVGNRHACQKCCGSS